MLPFSIIDLGARDALAHLVPIKTFSSTSKESVGRQALLYLSGTNEAAKTLDNGGSPHNSKSFTILFACSGYQIT
jgi:hypothetical protein